MYWVWLIIVVIAIILAIVLLNRFYRKASREVALIRTGLGSENYYRRWFSGSTVFTPRLGSKYEDDPS